MAGHFSDGYLYIDTRIFSKHHANRKWSELNRLGNSKLLRSSWVWLAIVPVAAKSLSSVDSIHLPFFGNDFILNAQLPFSWHIFFFSSLSFSIASLLYVLFCPDIVRRYKKISELKETMESEEAVQTEILCAYSDALVNRYKKYPSEIQPFLTSFLTKYGKKHNLAENSVKIEEPGYFQVNVSGLELEPINFSDSFRAARIEADNTRRSMRAACWYLYLVGFSLLFIVLLENLYFVSNSFIAYWHKESGYLNFVAVSLPIVIGAALALIYILRSRK